jgi:DNA-binding LacI/PurR family transcriptional regulator
MTALLAARGIGVPETMRVVGFDNRAAARHFDPPIPTSAPDFERLGETACGLLIEAMATGDLTPRTTLLDVPLLIHKPLSGRVRSNGTAISQGQRV